MLTVILIDPNAGSKDLLNYPPLDGIGIESSLSLSERTSADACVIGCGPNGDIHIGIELKCIADLIASWESGRLQDTQLRSMLDFYDIVYVLYYNEYRCGVDGQLQIKSEDSGRWSNVKVGNRVIRYAYLESSILLTLADAGARIKHVPDMATAALWLGLLDARWSRPWEQHKGLQVVDLTRTSILLPLKKYDPAKRQRIYMASAFPGLRSGRAVAAADYFETPQDMGNADVGDWMRIKGIGKSVATAVVRAMRTKS